MTLFFYSLTNNTEQLLHRQIQNVALSVFESDPVLSRRLSSLSLWTTLQALGRDTISARIIKAFDSCRIMYDIVSRCPGIRVLVNNLKFFYIRNAFIDKEFLLQSKAPGGETKTTISDLVMKPINFPVIFFQFSDKIESYFHVIIGFSVIIRNSHSCCGVSI